MKPSIFVILWGTLGAGAAAENVNPIQKVLEMLSGLQAKIVQEGEAAQHVYSEFSEWCEDRSHEIRFEIKTAKAEIEQVKAVIEKESSTTDAMDAKIDGLSATISEDEADSKAAAAIRANEHSIFAGQEKELSDAVDVLHRAIGIIEQELQSGSSFLQTETTSATNFAHILSLMVQASSLSTQDASALTALLQSSSDAGSADQDSEDDSGVGAPDAAAYENQSGGVLETMQGILTKAQTGLDEARATETKEKNDYELFKLALDDKVKAATNELDDSKKNKAEAEERRATAEGDLAVTVKDLASDVATLEDLHHECMSRATDFEEEVASRGQELKALAAAKKIIAETTSGAEQQSYGAAAAASFVQVRMQRTADHADLTDFKLVRFMRHFAMLQKSASLLDLAQRVSAAVEHSTSTGEDPFVKVKGLITSMVERLTREAEAEASKKEYCDKEMAETKANKEDKEDAVEKLSTRIDKMNAESKKLKEAGAILQKGLAELARSCAEAGQLRQEEHAAFLENKSQMEQGLEGIKAALKVLRDYYAADDVDRGHEAAEGAGSGILGLLEVAESDFSSGLSGMVQSEADAASEYDQNSKEAEVTQAAKEQDLKYKTKEAKALDKSVAEASGDRDSVQTELDAINEYYAKVKEECIAKSEPYAERKARREAEIAGLKEALEILDGEAVLIQTSSSRTILRGAKRAQ